MLLWQKKDAVPVCRVAIAGDFLPASGLRLPSGVNWSDLAAGFAAYFSGVDAAIVNLECALEVGARKPAPKYGLGDSFSASPDVLDFPVGLGAGIVGMANNHAYDYGEAGVLQTRQAIVERGLIPLGTGRRLSGNVGICA